jgi:hypothetical protein
MRRRPEQVLGEDSRWYPQAIEQARRQSKAITERLRKTIEDSERPSAETRYLIVRDQSWSLDTTHLWKVS